MAARIKEKVVKNDRNTEALYDLTSLGAKILISSHVIAFLWHFISYDRLKKHPKENGWLLEKGLVNSDWTDKYLYSFYWSVTTMLTVGYGDVTPKNNSEVIFNVPAMYFGCVIFGYSLNSIGEILKHRGEGQRIFK